MDINTAHFVKVSNDHKKAALSEAAFKIYTLTLTDQIAFENRCNVVTRKFV